MGERRLLLSSPHSQRMVVLPALSRPSTRMRASRSPNRESKRDIQRPMAATRGGCGRGASVLCVCLSLLVAVCTSTVSLSRAGWAVWEKGTGVCQGVHALQMARHAGSAVCVTPGGVFCFWNWCTTRRFSFVVLFSPFSLPPHAHTPSGTQPWRTRPAPHCPASWPSCPSSRRGRCACGVRVGQGDAVRRTGAAAAAPPSIERRRPHPCAALPPRHARTHTHAPLSCTGHRRRVFP